MNALLMQKFDEVVASIHALLKERGFKKARLHFARWRGDNLQVIGFQKSRHNGIMQSRLDFFVNAGVMDPLVVKTMFPDATTSQMHLGCETWGWRIDSLPKEDTWSLKPGTQIDALTVKLVDDIVESIKKMDAVPTRRELLERLLAETYRIKGSRLWSAEAAVALAAHLGDAEPYAKARQLLTKHTAHDGDYSVDKFMQRYPLKA